MTTGDTLQIRTLRESIARDIFVHALAAADARELDNFVNADFVEIANDAFRAAGEFVAVLSERRGAEK